MKNALAKSISELPEQQRRSLTWDRGKEFSAHAQFSVETDIPVFFADPQSPWQRGTNENTNGLLRQYFPKGTDLAAWSAQADRLAIVRLLHPGRTCRGDGSTWGRRSHDEVDLRQRTITWVAGGELVTR